MSEFHRDRHRLVARVLSCLDADFLSANHCYFGGGTRIVLELNEYRESMDIGFLCSDQPGYRALRSTVTSASLGAIVRAPVTLAREVRADLYGIRTFIDIDGSPVRFEIIREARIPLSGGRIEGLSVPVLNPVECIAEKLLANADRGLDASVRCRDLVDLAFMAAHWPAATLEQGHALADAAYGSVVRRVLAEVLQRFQDRSVRRQCLRDLAVADVPTLNRGLRQLRRL